MKAAIFSKAEYCCKEWHFIFLQLSLMSGFIVAVRFWDLILHSVCCNVTCHVALENFTVYSWKRTSEKSKKHPGIITKECPIPRHTLRTTDVGNTLKASITLALLLVCDPSSEWKHTPPHALDSVNLCHLEPTLLWKPSARAPCRRWRALLASWKLSKGSQMALVVAVPPDCSSDVSDRTWTFQEEHMGSSCQVCRGCVKVTWWPRSYFWKNRDVCMLLSAFPPC